MEILETLARYNAEGRPIWKPMHMQAVHRMNPLSPGKATAEPLDQCIYCRSGAVGSDGKPLDVGMEAFQRGLCLKVIIKMTSEQQDRTSVPCMFRIKAGN